MNPQRFRSAWLLLLALFPIAASLGEQKVESVIAVITVQNAENFTEAAMDMPALKNLETAMLQMTIEKARNSYAAQGFDPKTFKPSVQSSSIYVTVEGKKLAIVKATMNDQVRAVWIMGFRRDQFLRVTCLRSSNHDIPIFSGECGSKLTEAFSISLQR